MRRSAAFLGGFVAGEGYFGAYRHGAPWFVFSVGLGEADAGMCEALRDTRGVGRLVRSARRRPHYDDEVTFVVRRLRDLVEVIVPFMDEHLPPSHKRTQYLAWREALVDYWEHDARFGPRLAR